MPQPDLATVPAFYHNYIRQVTAETAGTAVRGHMIPVIESLQDLADEDWTYAYAPGKWSIKVVAQHLIDCERIFCHRALSIARGDAHPLPGFDENVYAAVCGADNRTASALLQELSAVATSTECLFASFSEAQLMMTGISNGKPISVNAIAFIIAGHTAHHVNILKERYLIKS